MPGPGTSPPICLFILSAVARSWSCLWASSWRIHTLHTALPFAWWHSIVMWELTCMCSVLGPHLIHSSWQTLTGGSPVKPWTILGRTEEPEASVNHQCFPWAICWQASSCWVFQFSWVFTNLWKGKPCGLGWVTQVHCRWCSWETGM